MNRRALCEIIGSPSIVGTDFSISSVTEDSRRVRRGSAFIAVGGGAHDGHAFAEQAAASGAAVILGARGGIDALAGVPYLFTPHPRRAAGLIAHALAGHPTRTLTVIGVTGTNGKSSVVYLIQQILEAAGHRTAKLGTLGFDLSGVPISTDFTTPFAEDIAQLCAHAVEAGASHLVMEASSIALEQERVAGIEFRSAVFTNLTQDHLDYHKTMEAYRDAKLLLFEKVAQREDGVAIVNADDPSASHFVNASAGRAVTFGKSGQVKAQKIRTEFDATRFRLLSPWGDQEVSMRLLGKHNVSNALCAAATAGALGISIEDITRGIAETKPVPGRFEPVIAGQDFHVIVDYAHTDDGLRNVLEAARALCNGRIICVFGCGGDRDRAKRPKMGAIAATLADFSIITSDNPRTEDPPRIMLDIEIGMQHAGKRKGDDYWVIENRAEAIEKAIRAAKPNDLVMIAGKGHEDYQIFGTAKVHFDDREVARAVLEHK